MFLQRYVKKIYDANNIQKNYSYFQYYLVPLCPNYIFVYENEEIFLYYCPADGCRSTRWLREV